MIHREPESSPPPPRRRRGTRRRRNVIRGLLVVLLLAALTARGAAVAWTDYLWFSSVGLTSVWRTLVFSRIILVVIASAVAFLVLFGNLLLADRLSPRMIGAGLGRDELIERFQGWAENYSTRIYLAVAGFFGILIGLSAGVWWQDVLLFFNSVEFGVVDPLFENDISFYVFRMPLYREIFAWAFQFLLWTTLLVAVLHYLNGGIQIQQNIQRVTPGVKVHLSVLLAALALLKAFAYWLDRYDLLYSTRGAVTGATFTDVRAQLPALNLLVFISIFAAILLLVNIRFQGWTLPLVATGLWLATSIIVGGIIPAAVQRFQVQPDEISKELEFVERNIEFTRAGFDLDRISVRNFAASDTLTAADLVANAATVDNIRLWDPEVLRTTYRQLEALRPYYQFEDVDVDRYTIDGELTQVMLAARELEISGLDQAGSPSQGGGWVNDHLVFTHGFGAVLSPANEVTFPEGQPSFIVNDIPPKSSVDELALIQPRIYFGEGPSSSAFVIVGTDEDEVDSLNENGEVEYNTYDGTGGVDAGSLFRRAAFALRFGDINTLLSGRITSDSKVLMVRNLQDRLDKVAPFLYQDADPYLVVEDGRLFWIVDMYTVTDRYPYSDDADTARLNANAPADLPNTFNYIRNSVKAVVDAYNGTMSLYIVDEEDPLVTAFAKIFPDLFTDGEEIPAGIRDNIRYPEDLFRVQSDMYTRYHVIDPLVFFNDGDPWQIARDPSTTEAPLLRASFAARPMLPYYLLMQLPNESEPSFLILQPFTPLDRPNMVSFLVAKSGPEQYGEMINFQFPSGNPPDGPKQVSVRLNQEPAISEVFTLLGQQGSRIIEGNMLVVPIEESILYVQPIYLQGGDQASAIPEFKRVVVVFEEKIIMRESLDEALTAVFGDGSVVVDPTEPTEPTEPTTVSPEVQQLLSDAEQAFADADAALRAGDLVTYAEKVEEAQALIEQALALLAPVAAS